MPSCRTARGALEGCWQEGPILARGGEVQKSSQDEGTDYCSVVLVFTRSVCLCTVSV